ncbi:hypothetical protein CCHR01_08221 [Colletotrichum chrysophilum]|uniref:Uncharacterized protein n=1 Tax=Colletotrichum chrysophilum TaxID=1836956 RepID=A0AAD9AJJ8_9PEZI|nr:hypothetical protein CCHR01_08221 [Colletotrichum chrysophilum]
MVSQTSHDVCDRCSWRPVPGIRRSLRVHNASHHRQGLEMKPNQPPHNRANGAGVGESVNGGLEGLNEQPEVINESIEEASDESNRSTPETEAGAGMASGVGRSYQNNFYNSIVYNINM